ncbi:MAG: DNA repair protein RecO [Candidatus Moranbacteria bacterium]|nr:DNA repair protein RecO [Candidatus Moranbacteria bacterium]
MELRLTAIVLRKKEIGETDRLYTFFTREMGKVQAKAIGVRKPAAKLAAALETLTLSDVTVVRGRGIGKVAGAIAEESFMALRGEYETLSTGLDTASVFDRLVGLEQPDERLFFMLSEYLSLLDGLVHEGKMPLTPLLTEAFFIRLFDELGYRIEADACAASGGPLSSGNRCFFSPEMGGIVTEEHAGSHSVRIGENAVKLIRLILGNRLPSILKVRVGGSDLAELTRIRKLFLAHIIG